MLAELCVPYRDTAAAELLVAVRAGGAAPPGLHALAARSGAFRLDLRVLGASHAVVARGPGGAALTEVVACGAAGGVPLAGGVRAVGGLRHALSCSVDRGVVPERARELRARAAAPGVLVAAFPGAPEALTALRALPAPAGGAAWETWHLYPATGEVVRTATTVVASAAAVLAGDPGGAPLVAGGLEGGAR